MAFAAFLTSRDYTLVDFSHINECPSLSVVRCGSIRESTESSSHRLQSDDKTRIAIDEGQLGRHVVFVDMDGHFSLKCELKVSGETSYERTFRVSIVHVARSQMSQKHFARANVSPAASSPYSSSLIMTLGIPLASDSLASNFARTCA